LTEYYNALANRDQNAGNIDIAVVVPKSGSLAGVYVQAISAYAPRPHAARLWMEFLYSDEGQLIWLKGYATPARFEAMRKAGLIPQDLLDKLPKTDAPVAFPTGDQNQCRVRQDQEWLAHRRWRDGAVTCGTWGCARRQRHRSNLRKEKTIRLLMVFEEIVRSSPRRRASPRIAEGLWSLSK